MTSINFWVAAARGADFKELKAKGFRVFYPAMDDYAFLEACDENKYLLKKQEELHIKFLRDGSGKGYQLVNKVELDKMQLSTQDNIQEGLEIKVVEGYCVGLEGKVLSREGDVLECELYGYRRVFNVTLTTIQVVKQDHQHSHLHQTGLIAERKMSDGRQ